MPVPKTLNDIYAATCAIDRPAIMKYKSGGVWKDITVPDFRDTVRRLSIALGELGVKQEDRVGILSEDRPEWSITDFGALWAAEAWGRSNRPARSGSRSP